MSLDRVIGIGKYLFVTISGCSPPRPLCFSFLFFLKNLCMFEEEDLRRG